MLYYIYNWNVCKQQILLIHLLIDMINTKKVLLIIFCILIPTAAIASCIHLASKKEEEVKGVSVQESGCVPYIINEIPRVAYVWEEYSFYPMIAGCSSDNVIIMVDGAPWLKVTDDMGIAGVPSITDVGTYKVEITAYGSSNSYTLTDYIIVKEYVE